ncbi:hypothetical protein ABL78_4584 [Leptomonas seymouri]|uniref:FYVE-type domain-containing protein n=1 Tax=Leptomonas seymouri TaxID=5684 RepID=A0A0N1I675_LEPSE|nr:hypothetical protein ABL78_4584 [Leptomonas seymouri]|eukprot:KPI86358.1 hypothetical protein ABL78_4584 [Leptomonas seymouri]
MQKDNDSFTAVPQSHWTLASSATKCIVCGKAFGLFHVAENCQGCGRVCCSNCLSDHVVLPGQPGTAPVPVCPICAKSIARTHEVAEMATERCRLLEEIINELALQAEKTRSDLREQQEENKLLQHEKERLKATITRMEIEAEVAVAKAQTTSAAVTTAAPPVAASSPKTSTSLTASPVMPDSEANTLSGGAPSEESIAVMEEKLNRKKRQLDMREATLKEALKKVSADATKNADQRAALQEQEKQLAAVVTARFMAVFEEERQRLEDVCADTMTDMQNTFAAWMGQQQDDALESRHKYEQLMEERQQRAAAELAEMRASRATLQHQLESQQLLIDQLQAEALSAVATQAAQVGGATQQQQQQWEEAEGRKMEKAAAAAIQRAEKAEEELCRLQAQLDSIKALYEEERHARAQQEQAEAARAVAAAAAVEAAEQKAAERHAQELAELQERLEAEAAANVEAALRRAAQQHAAAMESANAQHEGEEEALKTTEEMESQLPAIVDAERQQQQRQQQQLDASSARHSAKTEEREENTAAEALAQLKAAHEREGAAWEATRLELEAQLREAENQREKTQVEHAAALASAAQEYAAAVASLAATYQDEKEAQGANSKQPRRTQVHADEGLQKRLPACTEEKSAAQLQQQLRNCRQQLADLQAQHQMKTEVGTATAAQSRAAVALQRCAATFVKEVQRVHQRMLMEHTAAVSEMRSGLQEAAKAASATSSQREKKARETVKRLQAQVVSVQQEKEEVQQKLKAEKEKFKASLQSLQETGQQQQRAMAALQAKYQRVMDQYEAQKAEVATQAALKEAFSPHASASLESAAQLFEAQQRLVQQWAELAGRYAIAFISILQQEWLTVADAAVERLAAEAEVQRQMRTRSTKALENTTSTIKEVQEDLRERTQALVERQAAVEERERRVAVKKARIDTVCRDLYAVAKQLREKCVDSADCADVEELVRSARVMGEDV